MCHYVHVTAGETTAYNTDTRQEFGLREDKKKKKDCSKVTNCESQVTGNVTQMCSSSISGRLIVVLSPTYKADFMAENMQPGHVKQLPQHDGNGVYLQ